MLQIRRAAERGGTRLSWLDSRHSFSFGDYHDPRHMGVSALRVINEDHVTPGAGFGTHGHRDMEILTYVTDGTIAHADSTGERREVPAGEFQLMHAGKGIFHSEFNASDRAPLSFLQIWILPAQTGGRPGYEQRRFPRSPGLQLVVSPEPADGVLTIRQDARVHRGLLPAAVGLHLPLAAGRTGYLHLVRGDLSFAGHELGAGDGVAFADTDAPEVVAGSDAEFLFFDLPPAG